MGNRFGGARGASDKSGSIASMCDESVCNGLTLNTNDCLCGTSFTDPDRFYCKAGKYCNENVYVAFDVAANPCPASHPYLRKFGATYYYCYSTESGSSGACKMSNSGIDPPSDGQWGLGNANIADCSASAEALPAICTTMQNTAGPNSNLGRKGCDSARWSGDTWSYSYCTATGTSGTAMSQNLKDYFTSCCKYTSAATFGCIPKNAKIVRDGGFPGLDGLKRPEGRCPHTDGKTLNTDACWCMPASATVADPSQGHEACLGNCMKYCYENKLYDAPLCANTHWTQKNTNECMCGTNKCPANQYCGYGVCRTRKKCKIGQKATEPCDCGENYPVTSHRTMCQANSYCFLQEPESGHKTHYDMGPGMCVDDDSSTEEYSSSPTDCMNKCEDKVEYF